MSELISFILSFSATTIVGSYCMQMANELRIFKDVADAGYKINTKKFFELQKQFSPNAKKNIRLSLLIPGVNVVEVYKRIIQYNNYKFQMLDQLRVLDVLEEMSESEKEKYQKNPTGLNALFLPSNEDRLKNAIIMTIKDEEETSEIYYERGKSIDDITILKTTGPVSKLTTEEQKKKIIEGYRKTKTGMKEYGDEKSLISTLKKNKNLDLDENKNENKIDETLLRKLGLSERKQELENMKSKLLEEQKVIQSIQENKGLRLANNENIKK